jgi:hypothetical protein
MKVPQAVLACTSEAGTGSPISGASSGDCWWMWHASASSSGLLRGLIMWWRLQALRAWGAVAVGTGILSFVVLVWKL